MYNICRNTVILVIFILCWRERYLLNIIKLKAKETRIPERRIHQNIGGIFLWYNMSQGVQNSISVPLDRCGFGGQNIMNADRLTEPRTPRDQADLLVFIYGASKFAAGSRAVCRLRARASRALRASLPAWFLVFVSCLVLQPLIMTM